MWGFSELSSGIPISELLHYSLLEGMLFTPCIAAAWVSAKNTTLGVQKLMKFLVA
jgi:hypothetical protein